MATAIPDDQAAPGSPIRVVDEMFDANSESPTTPAPRVRPARNSSSESGLRRDTRAQTTITTTTYAARTT
ncbi:hypothetical protein [Marilutibacter chinensis]|uniref:Uncharacterized protein n=1 Tax=Marilutibacter chinensis TaxID=2912247 RepID=A0ABS9HTK9_9GAMM|nr:hypothetical protein [Lysobacter chinensis]MCF7222008.1 hypothetical protein [Lysobacter chinensis]